jgi:hypothetical protein
VLQGSPLSPWLFNLFIDNLLSKVNAGISGIPICLFYADNRIMATNSKMDLPGKLKIVQAWTVENMLFLNSKKCAVTIARRDLPPLSVYGQAIPQVETYTPILDSPLGQAGSTFNSTLTSEFRPPWIAHWLGVQSNSWCPTHQLRVYKQFLTVGSTSVATQVACNCSYV